VLFSDDKEFTTKIQVYKPVQNKFSAIGILNYKRSQFATAILPDGNILIVGGLNSKYEPVKDSEIFNPISGKCEIIKHTLALRGTPVLTKLKDGNFLLTGGGGTRYDIPQFGDIFNLRSIDTLSEYEKKAENFLPNKKNN